MPFFALHFLKCYNAKTVALQYDSAMTCAHCGSDFSARAGALTCSTRCRVAFSRRRPPRELVAIPRWVRHRNKVPLTVSGRNASSTNPETWATFDEVATCTVGDGYGFVLAGDGIACIDLDHCLVDGRPVAWAREFLARCPATYVEVSPSGTGLHIFGYAHVGKGKRGDGVEVYDRGRYMTVTGRRFSKFPARLADISALV